MAIDSKIVVQIKGIEWIVLSLILSGYSLVAAYRIGWGNGTSTFWILFALIMIICILTILFALMDLQVVYKFPTDID